MGNNTNIQISVRNLVEFVCRSGDIDNRRVGFSEKDAMQEGTRIHKKIQKQMGIFYTAEVSLKKLFELSDYTIVVEGRADGVFREEQDVYIDEIKGVYMDLAYLEHPVPIHRSQAMCYAYFFADKNQLDKISIQMTYVNMKQENIKRFREEFSFIQLHDWFHGILNEYIKWTDYQYQARSMRQASIKGLEFPFPYRMGQKDLVVSVYRSIQREKVLFIQAPTGAGKTISTIFPAVKAMGEGLGEKLFYLTAKTITRTVAEEAFHHLKLQGLYFKTITITAKEKICFMEAKDCNPVSCPYAKGHYDRVNLAVYDMLTHEQNADKEKVLIYAKKHQVCPFEMELDVSNWVDGILCDYNYVFDPTVRLKRYFAEGVKGDYLFLVDEAHNLVERAREMFSASLYKNTFLNIKNIVKTYDVPLSEELKRCNQDLLVMKRECDSYKVWENVGAFALHVMGLMGVLEQFLEEYGNIAERNVLLDFYFEIRNFLYIFELVDENYRIYTEHKQNGDFMIKLYCVNTAKNLKESLSKGKSTIFFSATLLPIQYYKSLLSGNTDDYAIYADSAFDRKKQLVLMATDVSSRYTRRNEREFQRICFYLDQLIIQKGNYMVFFPSYSFLEQVYETALKHKMEDKIDFLVQTSHMTEEEKIEFLKEFEQEREHSLVAFCVLGGIFSEGIDLREERLIGSIVVGTGLPQICSEREILKEYYEEQLEDGFDFAYRFPGINKVLQAAGRVIRTKDDKGVILLLDDRFLERKYLSLFPREWSDLKRINLNQMHVHLKQFWGL